MSRMRTIKAAAEEIRERDPDTDLTEYALRCMVKTGRIPCIRVGNKYLVNMDALERVLQGQ